MSAVTDSPRWCETCQGYGNHHTDRHAEMSSTTPDRQPSDAAVEAAARGMLDAVVSDDPEAYQSWDEMTKAARDLSLAAGRAALEAAYRVDAPRPCADVSAIEQLIGEAWDRGNAIGLDGYVGPNRGEEHVDPEAERDREVATYRAYELRVDVPRPLLDPPPPLLDPETVQKAVRKVVLNAFGTYSGTASEIADAVMELARPMPTRERIAEALSNATRDLDYKQWETPHGMLPFADAVLALLNGAES
jgi:hypothetical protein